MDDYETVSTDELLYRIRVLAAKHVLARVEGDDDLKFLLLESLEPMIDALAMRGVLVRDIMRELLDA